MTDELEELKWGEQPPPRPHELTQHHSKKRGIPMSKAWHLLQLAFYIVRAFGFNIAVALDLLLSALTLGDPRETVSSRLGKSELLGNFWGSIGAKIVDVVFLVLFSDPNHCYNAIQKRKGHGAISEVITRYQRGETQLWSFDDHYTQAEFAERH